MARNLEEFNNCFDGKAIFVIGAGASLHFQNLEPLHEYVTIAANSGILAFPQADFFVSDDWSVANCSYFFNDLKNSSATVLLYEEKLKSSCHLFGQRSVLFRHRSGSHITDTYKHDDYKNRIFQTRTSVGSGIHIAHIMGASKIVLLGVDCCYLQNKRYFWEMLSHKKVRRPYRKDGIYTSDYKSCAINGKQSDVDLNDIYDYWKRLGSQMLDKCNIYNASPHSILDVFPKVLLRDFIDSNKECKKNV